MFAQMMKWGVLLAIWRRYKHAILILPVVVIAVFVVVSIHNDYIAYVGVSKDDQRLADSFLIKWGCILVILCAYGGYIYRLLNKSEDRGDLKGAGAKLKFSRFFRSSVRDNRDVPNEARPSSARFEVPEESSTSDPFEKIRQKKKLRNKAEVIIEKKK